LGIDRLLWLHARGDFVAIDAIALGQVAPSSALARFGPAMKAAAATRNPIRTVDDDMARFLDRVGASGFPSSLGQEFEAPPRRLNGDAEAERRPRTSYTGAFQG
jgi:hypothetical protein